MITPKIRHAFAGVSLMVAALVQGSAAENQPAKLWYTQPAAKWTDALPLGNGRLGAMVFGGTAEERIQFNEDTLWTGRPHDYVRPDAGQYLTEIRRLILTGKAEEAQVIAKKNFLGDPVRQKAYQPFGDIRLRFPGHEKATNYRRELDLDNALARTTYEVNGVSYRRDVFASRPDQAIVMRITANQTGVVTFAANLTSLHAASAVKTLEADQVVLSGQVEVDGLKFEARLKIIPTGGSLKITGKEITVEKADSVTLVLVAATSFRNYKDISADPAQRCEAYMENAAAKNFYALRDAYLADYQRLYRRVGIGLAAASASALPTDQRLQAIKKAGLESDPALAALYFQYGRYLLIASSRPGDQPANLQGVWNEELNPPWESKFTTNINVEMNYWPAEVANLSECHEPLFDLTADVAVSGQKTAKTAYGVNGWVLHHNTDLWRGTAPVNNIDGLWPTGGAWLCHHLWEHYRFTGDRDFLEKRAYPLMRSASQFFAEFLVKDPKTGWLLSVPSYSPEQGTLTAAPTMDNQLIRALLDSTIEAAGILNRDSDFAEQLAAVRSQLPPNQVGREGQLQEWLEDVDQPNNAHRHMSPLWALYPGNGITPLDPKVFAATKQLLSWRGEGSTGWSYAWRIPLWARVGDGEFAHRQLSALLGKRTLPNMFDLCGPFQIDGNFGGAAGIAEMLLQSHQREPSGQKRTLIEFLPALPRAWREGTVRGLCARDGFEVDMIWSGGVLKQGTIRSKLGRPCLVRYGGHTIELGTQAGKTYEFDRELKPSS